MAACEVDQERAERAGEGWSGEVVLEESDGFPCRIVVNPTAVEIASDAAGSTPDPVRGIERGPDGRFYTATSSPGEIAVWDANGEFLNVIGRLGQGPGELDRYVAPHVGPDGVLHVFDAMGKWSRFAADGTFLESVVSTELLIAVPQAFLLLPGNDVIIAEANGRDDPQFRVLRADGSSRSFGSIEGAEDAPVGKGAIGPSYHRSLASTRAGTFWAGPWTGFPGGYVLEEWSTEGDLIRTIRRTPSWFPTEFPLVRTDDAIPPNIGIESAGGSFLIVRVLLKYGRGVASEGWIEVIDTRVPEVIASERMVFEPEDGGGLVFLRNTNLAYRGIRDSLGLRRSRIWEYDVVRNGTGSGAQPTQCIPD